MFGCALPLIGGNGDGGRHGAALAMATHECDAAVALVAEWERCGATTATPTDRRGQAGRTTASDPAQTALGETGSPSPQSASAAGGLPDDCASLQSTLGSTPTDDCE